jgi:hypothetical protein
VPGRARIDRHFVGASAHVACSVRRRTERPPAAAW